MIMMPNQYQCESDQGESNKKSQIVMSTVSVKDMMSMPVEPEITMMVMLKTDEVVALLDSTMKDFEEQQHVLL